MTTVHRLKATGAVLALAAAVTTTYVWGDAKPTGGGFQNSRSDPAPLKNERTFTEELQETKFSSQPLVIYETTAKAHMFGLQVKPELPKAGDRPRDLVILIDNSASQARTPIEVARQITEALIAAARAGDRISIWTVNTPAATRDLTRGFQAPGSAPIQEAIKFLKQDVPFGDTDLKTGVQKVIDSFENRLGRQRAIVFLGDGMSLHNPISNDERVGLCDKMIAKEITFYSVPLGIRLDSGNLHGFASGSGGLLVRSQMHKSAAESARQLMDAMAAPVFYSRKLGMPAEVTEFYPTKLPPLRSDVPTLVVGKIKPGQTLDYFVEGTVNGKDDRIKMSVKVPSPELDNFFLVGMVDQWGKADNRAVASPFRADRALALSFEKGRLAREELLAQAQWAMAADNLQAAAGLFEQAKQLDPNAGEADAGIKIINALREGKLTRQQMREQLGNMTGQAIRFEKDRQVVRDQFRNLLAQAENRMPERVAQNVPEQDNFLRDQRQRLAVEEQRIGAMVNDVERQANRLLATDPDAAHDLLKRTLQSIRDNVDLSPQTRGNLLSRLEGAVRSIDIRGARIKQELLDRQLEIARTNAVLALLAERQRAEEQVIRRMKAFDELMDQGRFNEAYREALVMQQDTINRGLEVDKTMVAAYQMGLTGTHLREVQEIKRASEERWLLTMLQVEKSHIPFPDEPPVEFPPASTWQKLTERRLKAGYDSAGLGEDLEGRLRAQEIQSRLKRPVNLDKGIDPNTPLKDALEFLSDRYDMTIIIDSQAFEAIGVQKPEETAVQLPRMVGVSLATVLRLLLNQIKGDVYKGTYIVRRDYIEVTTTYHAAAEKVIRAYPVADLVIAIPNSVNQQALQQSLAVYGQFVNSSPAYIGGGPGFGIGGGGIGGMGGAPAGGPGFQQGFNPFQFQGGVPGNNQYGNLGGQFGLQGQDTSFELLQLIVNVVAPGEWQPLFQANPQSNPGQNAPGGLLPGALAAPGQAGGVMPEPTVSTELLNAVGYYQPARALIIRGSSRTHSRLEGGITARPGAAPVMGGNFNRPPNALVIRPGENRNEPVAKDGPKDPKAVMQDIAKNVDPRTAWHEAIARTKAQTKNGLVDPGMIIACADFLVQTGKFEHAAELLKATLREGIVAEPWVFQSLAVALQLSNASADEIERAQLSAIDLAPQSVQSYMDAAKGMAELKRYDVAVALCRQAAIMEPGAPTAYANALVYAEEGKNAEGVAWAAGNLLRQEWPLNNDDLHGRAKSKLDDLTREMTKSSNLTGAQKLQQALQQAYRRDLVITLTWQGEADLDLKVKEAVTGTTCWFADRQTAGGGVLVGDILPAGETVKQWKETYVAAEAFSGEFEINVERTWGRPVGAKAILEIVRHQGTPNETRERHSLGFDQAATPIKVTLKDGRRTSVADLASPASLARQKTDDVKAPSIDVLSKLRSMTDPTFSGNLITSGLRGDIHSTGSEASRVATTKAADQPDRVAINTRVNNFVSGAMDVMAQTTIDPNQREMRVRMNPVFLNRNAARPAVANSMVPGGF